jgi:hypothetical protein
MEVTLLSGGTMIVVIENSGVNLRNLENGALCKFIGVSEIL